MTQIITRYVMVLTFATLSIALNSQTLGSICEGATPAFSMPIANSGLVAANPSILGGGQSFIVPAGITEIAAFEIEIGSILATEYSLDLYEGPATGIPGTPIASQMLSVLSDSSSNPAFNIYFQFDTPALVTPGNEYYFIITPVCCNPDASIFFSASQGMYSDGNYLSLTSGGISTFSIDIDLVFSILECPVVESVPTLGQWGTICLSLLILIIGTVYLRSSQVLRIQS